MTVTTSPRATRLQFSLRLLLSAFTGFAIGFPIWYRWPYQEIKTERDPLTGRVYSTRITTFQRQWGGGRLLHGPRKFIHRDMTTTTHYVLGLKHGPYTVRDAEGRMSETGQYVNDMQEGTWIASYSNSSVTSNWHRHRLHGLIEMTYGGRRPGPVQSTKTTAEFDNGRLVRFNGKDVDDAAFGALDVSKLDHTAAIELAKPTVLDVIQMPLKDCAAYLSDLHRIPIVADPTGKVAVDLPLTGIYRGLDLHSVLTMITAPNGLACDDRYGCIWITTAEDAKNWRDPTGVDRLQPAEGTSLSRAWNEIALNVDVTNFPLADVLSYVAQPLNIRIDTSLLTPTEDNTTPLAVTHYSRDLPFRHVLGQLLYKTGCRCEMQGDKLVILPPAEK